MPLDRYRRANLDAWNERVPVHRASRMYDADGFIGDPARVTGVVAFDAPRVGDVRGKSLLHLQCHFGLDTLSWARLGARVTGLDFSGTALEAAHALSTESHVPATFVEAELYDAPAALSQQFDVVYTGVGALNWLPDIRRWGDVVAAVLAPGGTFYLREAHPMLLTLDDERADHDLVVRHPYFTTGQPLRWDQQGSYADAEARFLHTVTYEWTHPISAVVQALLDAGLTLVAFEEHQTLEWAFFDWMVTDDAGRHVLPEGRERVPLMYSLKAVKPA